MIIFKANEAEADNRDARREGDKSFIQDFLKEIGAEEASIEDITRLGKRDPGKTRPLRIRFSNTHSKTLVMSKLKNLGDAPEDLKKIVVSHDLTPAQQENKKEMLSEALQKSTVNFYM